VTGTALHGLIKSLLVTQEEAACLIGTTKYELSRWIRGHRAPKNAFYSERIKKLASLSGAGESTSAGQLVRNMKKITDRVLLDKLEGAKKHKSLRKLSKAIGLETRPLRRILTRGRLLPKHRLQLFLYFFAGKNPLTTEKEER
jgi:hypothetical protein